MNNVQSELLGSGFLDKSFGGNISPSEALKQYQNLPELEKLLAHYGGKVFFSAANKYINQDGLIYKGDLSKLLTFDIENDDGKYSLSVGYHENEVPYWRFVNYGVKGVKSGKSLQGYSFKNEFPSRKMVDNIREYMTTAGKATRSISQSVSRHEEKQMTQAEKQEEQAYLLAKIIKMYGIKPREFMEKAAQDTFNKEFASLVTLAVGKDIKIFIKQWQ